MRVKICPNGHINKNTSLSRCEICGISIRFLTSVEYEEDHDLVIKEEKQIEEEKLIKTEPIKKEIFNKILEPRKVKVCPSCFEINEPNEKTCKTCGVVIYKVPVETINPHVKFDLKFGDVCINLDSNEKNKIGRSHFSNIDKEIYQFISFFHAEISIDEGALFLVDHSTNGTWINQKKCIKYDLYRIKENDDICFDHLCGKVIKHVD